MNEVRTTSIKRIPENGPLNITNYTAFLQDSKKVFNERWAKNITYKEVLDDFDQLSHLGTGSFGHVILVKYHKNNAYYAMKIMEKRRIVEEKLIKGLKNEKKVLQCINFQFAVYLHCCFQDNSCVYLVMPYVPYDLFTLLADLRKLDEIDAMFYVSQVVLALEYLHHLDLVYRDLKLEHILLDTTGYIKLTDFGCCKHIPGKRTYTMCGTIEYMAPEMFLNKGHGTAVDWWGCGVLVYELVAGFTPFLDLSQFKTVRNIILCRYSIPEHFSSELKDLVENILIKDLSKRFGNLKNGVGDIKNHRWFRPVHWMAIANRTATVPFRLPEPTVPENSNRLKERLPPKSIKTLNYKDLFEDF